MSRQADYWVPGREPTLAEVLSDPIVHLVMRRDGISASDVRAAVRLGQARLHGNALGLLEELRKSA